MIEHTLLLKQAMPGLTDSTTSRLQQEYLAYQSLFQAQPALVQQYLNSQSAALAEAITNGLQHTRFSLPDRINLPGQDGEMDSSPLPADQREQAVGGLIDRMAHSDLRTSLGTSLLRLEHSPNRGVSLSAILLRHATAMHMVYNMLPAGNKVLYKVVEGEEIPSLPYQNEGAQARRSMHGGQANSMVDTQGRVKEELLGPYVEDAQKFFIPQWVAFDLKGNLLAGSISEAEADLTSMQQFLSVLHNAVALAPYIVADEEYQRKRYGILGQLVNQGRAFARYEMREIITTIQSRVEAKALNRGLSLSLPYFDDQKLALELYKFEVIPVGRVMFVPAFIVLAVRAQGAKVAQDTRLSLSTRKYLLAELGILEKIFLRS